MTQPIKGVRNIPGFGTTLPTDKIDRQQELQRLLKRQEDKEEALHKKIAERYVEPGEDEASETQRRQGDQI